MATFGETLKKEREQRSITLREVSEATKIGLRYLEAMEEGRLDQLPGGLFNKGFIRAYAKYVGLDGEALVTRYLAEAKRPDVPGARTGGAGLSLEDPAPPVRPDSGSARPATPPRPRWILPALVVGGIVIMALAGLWILSVRDDPEGRADSSTAPGSAGPEEKSGPTPEESSAPAPAESSGLDWDSGPEPGESVAAPSAAGFLPPARDAAPSAATAPPAGTAADPPPAPRPAPLVAAFTVARTTYLEVWCDGIQRLGREVAAGETEQISCSGDVRVSSSDAGMVAMRIDGNDCLPLGEAGVPLSELTVNRASAAEICPPPAREH